MVEYQGLGKLGSEIKAEFNWAFFSRREFFAHLFGKYFPILRIVVNSELAEFVVERAPVNAEKFGRLDTVSAGRFKNL
jgi:hypothetical protein